MGRVAALVKAEVVSSAATALDLIMKQPLRLQGSVSGLGGSRPQGSPAFTLIELLVVIAIIAILA